MISIRRGSEHGGRVYAEVGMDQPAVRRLIEADQGLAELLETLERRRDDAAHDTGHLLRVAEWTLRLAGAEVAPREAIACALLHDLVNAGKNSPERQHAAEKSAQAARPLLEAHGFDEDAIDRMAAAIEDHSFSRGAVPRTPLGRALQDADRLDALGAIGIMRTVSTGAAVNSAFLHLEDPWAAGRPLEDQAFVLDHFFTKLLRLPEKMLTETGREEAERRVAFMRSFLHQLGIELGVPFPEGPPRAAVEEC